MDIEFSETSKEQHHAIIVTDIILHEAANLLMSLFRRVRLRELVQDGSQLLLK